MGKAKAVKAVAKGAAKAPKGTFAKNVGKVANHKAKNAGKNTLRPTGDMTSTKQRVSVGSKNKSFSASRAKYGKGSKRVTILSASKAGYADKAGKRASVAIGPKKRIAGYSAAAGAGGYTTYKRRTKSGKVVTVRRKGKR